MEWIYQSIKPTLILGGILATVALAFDFRWSLSILLGVAVSLIHLNRLDRKITLGLKEKYKKGKWFLIFMGNFILLTFPLLLAIRFPQWLNIFAVVIGLLLNKVILYSKGIMRKGEDAIE